jgi:hypothetical protein
MTLEASFNLLSAKWTRMAEEFEQGLLWSVMETKPADEHALATYYVDGVTDLVGFARAGLDACRSAVAAGSQLPQVGQTLLQCQRHYNAIVEQFGRLASCERLRRLRRFGREKGHPWAPWVAHVRKALDHCRRPMDDVNQALFDSWQEVTERIGMSGVSLQTTNIGQQITLPKTEAEVESIT